jgi:hypothetical protein
MQFRKKPVVVEASQWFKEGDHPGVDRYCNRCHAETNEPLEWTYFVITIHGQVAGVAPGDWIITEPDGKHFYPCKPDIFEATYEKVE